MEQKEEPNKVDKTHEEAKKCLWDSTLNELNVINVSCKDSYSQLRAKRCQERKEVKITKLVPSTGRKKKGHRKKLRIIVGLFRKENTIVTIRA